MKHFFLILIFLGCHYSYAASPSAVTCSQIDFLFYDSQCCDAANDVSCLQQLSKLDYDTTIADLSGRIDDLATGSMTITGDDKELILQSGAELVISSDNDQLQQSKIVMKDKSKMTFETGSLVDFSAISVTMGQTQDVRTKVDHIQLSDVTGKGDKINLDDPLHANKGIVVDADRFVVEDVSGNVVSKGSIKAWGDLESGSFNVNDKFKVASDGTVTSVGAVEVSNSLHIKDGVNSKFTVNTDGTVEAKGKVSAKAGLEVLGGVSEFGGGINVNDMMTVDGLGNTEVKGTFKAVTSDITLGAVSGTITELQGTTRVPASSKLVIEGQFDISAGAVVDVTQITAATATISVINADVDFNGKAINNLGGVTMQAGAAITAPIEATTLSASGAATFTGTTNVATLTASGNVAMGAVTVQNNDVAGVGTLSVNDATITTTLSVNAVTVADTLAVSGASTLDATTAASVVVNGATTLKGAVAMEGDVTFEKKMMVNEELQIGTGTTTPASSGVLVEAGKTCETIAVPKTGAGTDFRDVYDTADDYTAKTTPADNAAAIALHGLVALYILNNGGICVDATTPYIGSAHNDDCPAGFTWKTFPTFTGKYQTLDTTIFSALCADDNIVAYTETPAFTVYKSTAASVSGAVDFAKDGTLKTSGKATLASLEVEGASAVVDLTSTGIFTFDKIQTSTETNFNVDSLGAVTASSVTVSGALGAAGATSLSATLDVAGASTFKETVKTIDTGNSDADGVVLGVDGSVAAKSLSVDGGISGKDNLFNVNDAGTVQAVSLTVVGHTLPMYQESTADSAKCTSSNGIVMHAIGICDKADNADGAKTLYREWTCAGSVHFVTQTETSNMGKCSGDVAASATYVWDVCNQNGQSFCEEIETRAQCEGTPDIIFIDPADPATLNDPAVKVWTSNGDITLRHCQSTYVASGGGAANLVPLPTST